MGCRPRNGGELVTLEKERNALKLGSMPISKFEEAFLLASQLHADQYRKGTEIPYISHLMAVCSLVLEACDLTEFKSTRQDLAIAALLHGALEDQGHKISLQEIEQKFGVLVAKIVSDCSDDVITSEGQQKAPWRDRKIAYVAHIGKTRKETQLVSCADKLHNSRCILADYERIGNDLWSRFSANKADILWYYQSLAQEFVRAWPENPLAPELRHVVGLLG
jgi:(p)ppGpp synthase/HD superfamily hydrolase